ncbi:hypothetical protein [Lentzea sp. NPDC051838]|uniref:hypothetical protein n=1 Tax=Lentzea sp. NPDC051838 TaxID=3154849 RepID=UPI00343637AA
MKHSRRWRSATALIMAAACVCGLGLTASTAVAAGPPRVDLNVLVVTDGTPWVEAIRQQMASEGVATTVVDLNNGARPAITSSFLSGTLAGGTPHAKFQGVVLPSDFPAGLAPEERSALTAYETSYAIREVDSFVYPSANVGMNTPTYAGSLDGATITVTSAARSDAFRYLGGTFKFDGTPGGPTSYGYLGQPLPNTTTSSFTPMLTAKIPGTATTATLAGVYTTGTRQQLAIGFGYNYYQGQFRYLAHGIIDWVTKGVHFGYWRNYFSVHIDDVFSYDAIWSDIGKCTPGDGVCPPGTPDTTPVRMTGSDVSYAVQWQQQNNFTLDMLYNGGASAQYLADNGGLFDPLLLSFQLNGLGQFRWVNHTYTHPYLGCVQDFTVIPWRCSTDAAGNTVWVSSATINGEIKNNVSWAKRNGIPVRGGELVAGEHSGTFILPQQPLDNPNFTAALGPNAIKWLGLDASREPNLRAVGAAVGLPRHPINVFYNVAKEVDEVSEYNWLYTSQANGGSGICENNPTTTCIAPLDRNTGWDTYILPQQIQITLGYVLQNDPRPFYMHQSNLVQDRLAYQVMSGVLSTYRGVFNSNTPVVNATMTQEGQALAAQNAWAATRNAGTVSGYIQGNTVVITGPAGTQVPMTVPNQTKLGTATFGGAYAGQRSDYTTLGTAGAKLTLPSTPYPISP